MNPSAHPGLEVVVGSMFSGKSEELIRRVKRAVIARRTVEVFKPVIDDRYGVEVVRSHDGDSFVARPVRSSTEIASLVGPDTSVVGVDEVQFFDAGIVSVVRGLVASGRRVICAGLDLDFRGEPFGPVPILLAIAERVDKLEAICVVCGEPATRTLRMLMRSADVQLEPEERATSGAANTGAMFIALALALVVFIGVPYIATQAVRDAIPSSLLLNVAEGLLRLVLFLGYLGAISFLPDIRRVFAYHGAEHMTIHAFEHGDPLTPPRIEPYPTAHPRCGTPSLLFVVCLAIGPFACAPRT